jgi:hypothetical protein
MAPGFGFSSKLPFFRKPGDREQTKSKWESEISSQERNVLKKVENQICIPLSLMATLNLRVT